jgi:hypothetical protein
MSASRYLVMLALLVPLAHLALGSDPGAAEETPVDVLGARVRAQGYRCERPAGAERDAERSRPDAPVWILRCEDASYRIRLVPDMAAHVEQIR